MPGEFCANPSRSIRMRLELSIREFAELLGVSGRQIIQWENFLKFSRPEGKVFANLKRVYDELDKMGGKPKHIVQYLKTADPDLRGYAPVDLLGSDYATEELVGRIKEWGEGPF